LSLLKSSTFNNQSLAWHCQVEVMAGRLLYLPVSDQMPMPSLKVMDVPYCSDIFARRSMIFLAAALGRDSADILTDLNSSSFQKGCYKR
jgi:hypothetical protein